MTMGRKLKKKKEKKKKAFQSVGASSAISLD